MAAKTITKTVSAKAKTNGSAVAKKNETASTAKTANAKEPAKKKRKEPTLEEVTMAAWEYTYKNRHKRLW
jgi:hypothetical protein